MITKLSIDEVLQLVASAPEQAAFDWKQDFTHPKTDEQRGELLKDIAAIANSSLLSHGFIVYGVDPRRPDPLVGITATYDDSRLQQLVKGKIDPHPKFLYYEVSRGPKVVGVVHVLPSNIQPFIISVDVGKVRAGQIVVRRGSATEGATLKDLSGFFYGPQSARFAAVRQHLGLDAQRLQAEAAYMDQLERGAERNADMIWGSVGMPRPGRRR